MTPTLSVTLTLEKQFTPPAKIQCLLEISSVNLSRKQRIQRKMALATHGMAFYLLHLERTEWLKPWVLMFIIQNDRVKWDAFSFPSGKGNQEIMVELTQLYLLTNKETVYKGSSNAFLHKFCEKSIYCKLIICSYSLSCNKPFLASILNFLNIVNKYLFQQKYFVQSYSFSHLLFLFY